jgi:hypothetical protein
VSGAITAASAASSNELWGTFAVDDHLRPRAFVAETILFDRVVIPLPPKANDAEHRDWVRAGWQPNRLLEIKDRLGGLAVGVPWTEELRFQWRAEYSGAGRPALQAQVATLAAADAQRIKEAPPDMDGRALSRSVLARKIGTDLDEIADRDLLNEIRALDLDPAGTIEVVMGYGSLAKYRSDATAAAAQREPPGVGPATLFVTWDFLVPEDSTLSDNELLLKAVALSSRSDFRDARRRFHEWRSKLAANGVSVAQARAEMNRCLALLNEITAKERRRNRCLTALQAVATAAPLADLLHHGGGVADAASVLLNLASMSAERLIPHYRVGDRESVAALVHDSREAFGWRPHA